MPDKKEVLLRHISEIASVCTSHGIGDKKVIATSKEVGENVTQIAQTLLHAGENVDEHIHPTMDEHFFFLDGKCNVIIDGNNKECTKGDYLFIPSGHTHSIKVISNTLMFTIGIIKE